MIPLHVAAIRPQRNWIYLFLKNKESHLFQWFEMDQTFKIEKPMECTDASIVKAILKASLLWKEESFRLLHCGFRYSLPERDEVGSNAFFWQMAKSYSDPLGHYLDPELGHKCFVDFASHEALEIWRKIR